MIFINLCKCIIISTLVKFNIYNEKLIKILIQNIYKCGVIPVKMVQWGLPYMKLIKTDKSIINILENTYEKCPEHNNKHTEELYMKHFYNDIKDDYDIINIIGSGSIAQVYKIKDKKTGKIYAMKVKHPNADRDFNTIKFYMKIIFSIFSFNKIIPMSLTKFLNQFEEQLDFINESNNIMKFGKLYENNNLYKIPKLYKFSRDIIIMDYIPGKSLDTIDNNTEHYKYHIYIFVFSNNNLYINDFNHGDLHNYNWKITEDNKIVIYDFGLCWEFDSKDIINTISILNEGFYNEDNEIIYRAFYNFIKSGSDIDEKYVKEYFDKIPCKINRFIDLAYYLIDFCLQSNILMNVKLLYNIISYQNMVLIFMNNFQDCENDYEGVCKEEYNICDYYDILPKYKLFLKNEIKKYPRKGIDYNNLNKFIT